MGWIKRNLFFTIGGVIALALLGAAAYYTLKNVSLNRENLAALQDSYNELQNLYNTPPTPSPENIAADKDQLQQLRDWIAHAQTHFAPVPPIPNPPDGVVTTPQFAGSLRKTIHDMQTEAEDANVDLPPDYSFSFAAERPLVTFAPGSLNALASHLGEVKAICEVLFKAKINGIDGIQREIVSDNDSTGAQSDYLADKTRQVDSATITPYAVTIRCFSSDLANVLTNMAASDHCFIVTGINVMPAGATMSEGGQNPPPMSQMPGQNGGLQTVLDEQVLRVTLGLEVVKLSK